MQSSCKVWTKLCGHVCIRRKSRHERAMIHWNVLIECSKKCYWVLALHSSQSLGWLSCHIPPEAMFLSHMASHRVSDKKTWLISLGHQTYSTPHLGIGAFLAHSVSESDDLLWTHYVICFPFQAGIFRFHVLYIVILLFSSPQKMR